MTSTIRSSLMTTAAALVFLTASTAAPPAGAAAGAPAAAGGTIVYTLESEPAFEHQLAAGQIRSVTINKRIRSLRITLISGQYFKARYPRHQEGRVAGELRRRGVHVSVLSQKRAEEAIKKEGKKPVKHHLRYIAGGLLLLAIVVVAVVVINRRRKRSGPGETPAGITAASG